MSGRCGCWRAGPSAEPGGPVDFVDECVAFGANSTAPQLVLAGDAASCITGHTLIVDCGWTTR